MLLHALLDRSELLLRVGEFLLELGDLRRGFFVSLLKQKRRGFGSLFVRFERLRNLLKLLERRFFRDVGLHRETLRERGKLVRKRSIGEGGEKRGFVDPFANGFAFIIGLVSEGGENPGRGAFLRRGTVDSKSIERLDKKLRIGGEGKRRCVGKGAKRSVLRVRKEEEKKETSFSSWSSFF